MIDTEVPGGSGILAVGVVRGRLAEIPPLLERLARFAPRAVGVGVSPDELAGLREHFAGRPAEPLVQLTSHELAEVGGLAAYGEARVPNPIPVALLEWGAARGIPVSALEPSDEEFAQLFASNISYVELVRRTLRERRLARAPPEPATADEFAVTWDRSLGHGAGSRRLAAARERAAALAGRKLASASGRTALVVDRERFDGVVAAL